MCRRVKASSLHLTTGTGNLQSCSPLLIPLLHFCLGIGRVWKRDIMLIYPCLHGIYLDQPLCVSTCIHRHTVGTPASLSCLFRCHCQHNCCPSRTGHRKDSVSNLSSYWLVPWCIYPRNETWFTNKCWKVVVNDLRVCLCIFVY